MPSTDVSEGLVPQPSFGSTKFCYIRVHPYAQRSQGLSKARMPVKSRKRRLLPYVLLVDDDQDSLNISKLTLEWAGVAVRTASTAAEALTMAFEEPPAVALIDLYMPVMTGIAVLRALRADPKTEHIAAIALTGVPEMLDTLDDIRFDWVLTKPIAADDLVRIVKPLIAVAGGPYMSS